jgi:hypothetical protein
MNCNDSCYKLGEWVTPQENIVINTANIQVGKLQKTANRAATTAIPPYAAFPAGFPQLIWGWYNAASVPANISSLYGFAWGTQFLDGTNVTFSYATGQTQIFYDATTNGSLYVGSTYLTYYGGANGYEFFYLNAGSLVYTMINNKDFALQFVHNTLNTPALCRINNQTPIYLAPSNGYLYDGCVIPFNNILSNNASSSNFNVSTNTYTVPKDGVYQFLCTVGTTTSGTTLGQNGIAMKINGVTYITNQELFQNSLIYYSSSISVTLNLTQSTTVNFTWIEGSDSSMFINTIACNLCITQLS